MRNNWWTDEKETGRETESKGEHILREEQLRAIKEAVKLTEVNKRSGSIQMKREKTHRSEQKKRSSLRKGGLDEAKCKDCRIWTKTCHWSRADWVHLF